jgi:hypothetical protein
MENKCTVKKLTGSCGGELARDLRVTHIPFYICSQCGKEYYRVNDKFLTVEEWRELRG